MTNTISFVTANFVARELGYHMTGGWGQGVRATVDHFRPIETYAERFEVMLQEIVAMGFQAIDLWEAHLHPSWASDEHIAIVHDLLQKYHLQLISLAGGFGNTPEEFTAMCGLAVKLGRPILGGSTNMLKQDREWVVATLKEHGLKLGLENHPEKTPREMLEKIGDGYGGTLGVALDTGWFGTQGYNAAVAIQELADHLLVIHLKDVLAAGGHETCRFGRGVVPVQTCVETIRQIGYNGPISVEHEPEHFDPTEDIIASRQMLDEWLAAE
jgi:L-ribulose-5-phosphate 3-epimerase